MPSKRRVSQKKKETKRREKKYKKKSARHRMTRNRKQGGSNSSKISGYLTDIERIMNELSTQQVGYKEELLRPLFDAWIGRALRISQSISNSGMSNSMTKYVGPTDISDKSDKHYVGNSIDILCEIITVS